MYSAYWQCILHYNSPACFSCSIVSFEGSESFSCVSVFLDLIYQTSQSQPYQVCQTWLQKVWSKLLAIKVWSVLWPQLSADVYYFNCYILFYEHATIYSLSVNESIGYFQVILNINYAILYWSLRISQLCA